jgi:hypothetical protein
MTIKCCAGKMRFACRTTKERRQTYINVAKLVTQKHFIVTLYVRCLSYFTLTRDAIVFSGFLWLEETEKCMWCVCKEIRV